MTLSRNTLYIVSCVAATAIWAVGLVVSVFWGLVKLVDLMGSNLAFILLAGLVGSFAATIGAVANYLIHRPKVSSTPKKLAPLAEETTQADVEKQLQAFIEADPALFNLSGYQHTDPLQIRPKADRLNVLAARAKGILGSKLNMEESIVNADLVVQMPNADGYLKEIATRILGKLREHQASTVQDNQMQSALDDQHLTELDVVWHLSRDVQPVPPFGSQDMPGSDKVSTLHVIQRGKEIRLTANMNRLKPSYRYQVELGRAYTSGRLIREDNIGGSRTNFTTDKNGSASWSFTVTADEFASHGIKRFSVWVGDVPKNATVLLSENIPLKFSLEVEEKKTQTQGVPNREGEDFRNGVATEVHSLLKIFIDPLHHWDVSCPSWSSKAEQSKAALLGKEDYLVLRALYDAIEERNRYFAWKDGMTLTEVDPLNRKCVEAFSRAYGEVTWLRIASDTDSILSKARKNVGLPT